MKYYHLSEDERLLIDHFFNIEKLSISQIAKKLNRNKATISRELKRNVSEEGFYLAQKAQHKYQNRFKWKHAFYLLEYQDFSSIFLKKYDKKYHGIKATYNYIVSNHPEVKKPSLRQVFNWIKTNKWVLKRSDRLRQYCKKGGKRTKGIFSKFTNKFVLQIWVRPKYIDLRQEFGHWEVDLVIGCKSSGYDNLLTFNERLTRKLFIVKVKSKNPMKINSEIYKIVKSNNLICKSITVDNGIEFAKLGILASWLSCKIYFCEPYASYQRGSNENLNGLIEEDRTKKGFNFNELTSNQVFELQEQINNMPREIFNWRTSNEMYNLAIKNSSMNSN